MFEVVYGNIFKRNTDAIVNPVNTVGVMGAGLAKSFKAYCPPMFQAYQIACQQGEVQIGKVDWFLYKGQYIVNFPTKQHWRNPSSYAYIQLGLEDLAKNPFQLNSISLPALGCGLGGLHLSYVQTMIQSLLDPAYSLVELVLVP